MKLSLFARILLTSLALAAVTLLCLQEAPQALAQSAPAAVTQAAFDPVAATDAYLARLTPEQKARSDAYFEGKYWLILWNLLAAILIAALLLESQLSARMRDRAARITQRKPLQTAIYSVQYLLLASLLMLPLMFYQDFYREQQYGLSNLSPAGWTREYLIVLVLQVALLTPVIMATYGVIRRAPQTWHWWATGIAIAFLVLQTLVYPVFIAPLFNRYEPLADGTLKQSILSLARANGMAASEVYQFDASKQSKRISANVTGLLGTTRISLNDNLLERVSPAGVKAVMGHELGHYVLHHIYRHIASFGLLFGGGFVFVHWGMKRALAWRGQRWGVRDVGDVASLPLLVLLFAVWLFLLTPVTNTLIRTAEVEADLFGLNAAREPDGFAEAAMLLAEYRKMEPGPIEEFVFFDHPSGKSRIYAAMRWKAEQLRAP